MDQDYENAILYLKEGIETNETGTKDGRFYFNLGDALQRLGRNDEAREVEKKVFSDLKQFSNSFIFRFIEKGQTSEFFFLNIKDLFTT